MNCLFSFKFQVIPENTSLIVIHAPKQIIRACNHCKFSCYELKLFRILLTELVQERKANIFVQFSLAIFLSASRRKHFQGTEEKETVRSSALNSLKDSFKWKTDKKFSVHEKFKLFIGQKVNSET